MEAVARDLAHATREGLWERFKCAPAPMGYDPEIILMWEGSGSQRSRRETDALAALCDARNGMLTGKGEVLSWQA